VPKPILPVSNDIHPSAVDWSWDFCREFIAEFGELEFERFRTGHTPEDILLPDD
jgi:hypothetical protein